MSYYHLPLEYVFVIGRHEHVVEVEFLPGVMKDPGGIREVDPLVLIEEVIPAAHLERLEDESHMLFRIAMRRPKRAEGARLVRVSWVDMVEVVHSHACGTDRM